MMVTVSWMVGDKVHKSLECPDTMAKEIAKMFFDLGADHVRIR